ncbi:hypothetical protein C0995_013720, partial [Termitomyces sp. Mi166
ESGALIINQVTEVLVTQGTLHSDESGDEDAEGNDDDSDGGDGAMNVDSTKQPEETWPGSADKDGDRSQSASVGTGTSATVTKESTQKRLQLYVPKHMQMLANMGQHAPEVESTQYIKLYLQIFELELEEYMNRKEACTTARSTATLAESVDYDTIRRQRVPVIAEVMDALNAPQQAEESQQDFERRQNAAR